MWGIFFTKALQVTTYLIIFPFTGLALSYYITLILGWYKSPKSSFHTILELFHLSPSGIHPKEVAIRGTSGIVTEIFGGSSGPEGPSAIFGAVLATYLFKKLRISIEPGKALLVGVAAGISAVFKTPLTGLMFALELPYRQDLDKDVFMEAAIASCAAYLVSYLLGTPSLLPRIAQGTGMMEMYMIPYAIGFGSLIGLASLIFTRLFDIGEKIAKRLSSIGGYPLMLMIGGLALGFIGLSKPEALGPGFHLIPFISNASFYALVSLFSFKLVATVLTFSFGGSGGTFLPVLYIGALWGAIFGMVVNPALVPLFVLMGMAGFTAGVHKMMITPIILIAESYGSNNLIPIILVTVVTYFIAGNYRFFPIQPKSKIIEEELALERFYYKIKNNPPKALFSVKAIDIMTPRPVTLDEELTIRTALEVFISTTYRVLPVVTKEQAVVGYVTLEDLAAQPLKMLDSPLGLIEIKRAFIVSENDAMLQVIENMIDSKDNRCFIVDVEEHLVGVISTIDVTRLLLKYYTNNG